MPGQGTATVPAVAGSPVASLDPNDVPWQGQDFREYLDELLTGAEESRVEKRKLDAMASGFGNDAVKVFAADAKFPGSSKRMIAAAGSNGLARIFNKVRFSKDYGEGALAVLAVGILVVHNKRSDTRFKRAVMELQKKQQPKPEEKKS